MEENDKKVSVKINKIWWILGILVVIVIVANVYVITNNKNQTSDDKNFNAEKQANAVKQVEANSQNDVSEEKIDSDNLTTSNKYNISNSTKLTSSFEIGYEEIVAVLEGKPYIIPFNRHDLISPNIKNKEEIEEKKGYDYNKFEVDNIKSGVKSAYAVSLGYDSSCSYYFVMEDGSVRELEETGTLENVKFTSEEVVSSSKKIVELEYDGNILNGITKDGNKIEIAKSMDYDENSNNIDTTTVKTNENTNSESSIEIGYERIIIILYGKPYIIPIDRLDLMPDLEELEDIKDFHYNKFEIDNIKSGVKSVYSVVLGTDPSSSYYFVMADGSVRTLIMPEDYKNPKFSSEEVISSSEKVVELNFDGDTLNAITKDGKKIKIADAV